MATAKPAPTEDEVKHAIAMLAILGAAAGRSRAEERALATAVRALLRGRDACGAELRARADLQLVHELAAIYRVASPASRRARRAKAQGNKAASSAKGRAASSTAVDDRLGRTVFEAIRDAVNDWAQTTGEVGHPVTQQPALEELELDDNEIRSLGGPMNAAAQMLGRLGVSAHGSTFARRRRGVLPLGDPDEPGEEVEAAEKQRLAQLRLVLESLGFARNIASREARRLLRRRQQLLLQALSGMVAFP